LKSDRADPELTTESTEDTEAGIERAFPDLGSEILPLPLSVSSVSSVFSVVRSFAAVRLAISRHPGDLKL